MRIKEKFDYGKYIVEYHQTINAPVCLLRKKITDVEKAQKERERLLMLGMHDVVVRKNTGEI